MDSSDHKVESSCDKAPQGWCQVVTCLMQQEAAPLIPRIRVGTAYEQLLPDCIVDARQAHQLVQVVLADGKVLHSSDSRAFSSRSSAGDHNYILDSA